MTRKSTKGIPRPQARGPRPHIWVAGPDPVRHRQYLVWIQQRNQANFRGEDWDLDFDTWLDIWGDDWQFRGRTRDDKCMTRQDWSLPWSKENVHIVSRIEHARQQATARNAGWRSLARKRKLTGAV